MSEKAIVFIDGGWLYRCRTALFSKLGEDTFEIDYAKLPRILCDDVANFLDEDVSLVKTLYFGTIPSVRSGFNTSKQSAFYDFLERTCGYDTNIHEVDVGGNDENAAGKWVYASLISDLVYYSTLPSVMDIAIIAGDCCDIVPAIRKIRSLGKRVQAVCVGDTPIRLDVRHNSDFPDIRLDEHAADVKLVRERLVRVCKRCGREEETTWAGTDFFCSHCRGRYRGE